MICLFIILLVCHRSVAVAQSNYISDTSTATINFRSEVFSLYNSAQPKYLVTPLNILPSNQYLRMIGFFCKKEIQFEKVIKMPVRFRLGSVAYTDRMEASPRAVCRPMK
jgi:hypothetical protein